MKVGGQTIDQVCALTVRDADRFFADLTLSEKDAAVADKVHEGDPQAAGVPARRRARLPDARSPVVDAVGRRIAAHQPGDLARVGARRHAVRPRRAVDRPPLARQRAAHHDPPAAARPGQHRPRRRARRRHDSRRRHGRRHGARRRRAGRPRRLFGHARGAAARAAVADRQVPARRAGDSGAGGAPQADEPEAEGARRERAQPEEHRRRDPARAADGRDRRQRIGQEHARARRHLRGAQAREGRLGPPDRRAPQARGRRVRHRRRSRGSGAHRPHAAVQSRDLPQGVRPDPGALRRDEGRAIARAHGQPLLVQRARRPLRGVRRRGRGQGRDAVPRRRVRAVRAVRGQAVQAAGPRRPLPRPRASTRCST